MLIAFSGALTPIKYALSGLKELFWTICTFSRTSHSFSFSTALIMNTYTLSGTSVIIPNELPIPEQVDLNPKKSPSKKSAHIFNIKSISSSNRVNQQPTWRHVTDKSTRIEPFTATQMFKTSTCPSQSLQKRIPSKNLQYTILSLIRSRRLALCPHNLQLVRLWCPRHQNPATCVTTMIHTKTAQEKWPLAVV
jgi:hypothetical protein